MLPIPKSCIHTRSTPFWNKDTAPAGIFKRHLDTGTQPGVYPRLSVMRARCDTSAMPTKPPLSRTASWSLRPGILAYFHLNAGTTSK